MKKLLLFLAIPFLFCTLSAQVANKDVVSLQNEVSHLKKSNATLKAQLNEQNKTLLAQIETSDSIIALYQSTTGEVKKNAASQNELNGSVNKLTDQTAHIYQILGEISLAFEKRKFYTMAGAILALLIIMIFVFLLNKKIASLNKVINQLEDKLNKNITQSHDNLNRIGSNLERDLNSLRVRVDKENKDIYLAIEKLKPKAKTKKD